MDGPGLLSNCRVCGGSNVHFLCHTYNEHSRTSQIAHFRCRECGSVYVANSFEPDELAAAYSTRDTVTYFREIKEENERKIASAMADVRELAGPEAAIIDIGAGDGAFAEHLLDAGFGNVSVHEIPGRQFTRLAARLTEVYSDFDYESIPSGAFDLVSLLDVLEHVRRPEYLVRQCARILKPGGVLYFHTPVVTRLDRLVHGALKIPKIAKLGAIWQRGRTSVFHLENYTDASLRLLLQRAGLAVRTMRIMNELSWPVSRYVRVYLKEKARLPEWLVPPFTFVMYPLLATSAFNANKAIVTAKKS